jgi:predicted ATPase/class 3 adenylate cyclase
VPDLPIGTVALLFTDIEASTRLWQEHPDAMRPALARHDELLRQSIDDHHGLLVKSTGDGALAVFGTAADAIGAAIAAQRAIDTEPWPVPEPLKVRMGIHVGSAEQRDGDYYGAAVNLAARLMSVAHGGQVVVSLATEELAGGQLPTDVRLLDLGEHTLRDVIRPERVFQVVHPGLPQQFPPLLSQNRVRGNLVSPTSTFVGRDRDVVAITALLHECPVVTLVGVGGVGKTRLALEVARRSVRAFPDGVWFVPLAGVGDEALFDEALAATLQVAPRPAATLRETVLDHLRDKRMLVVLDNCEHLVAPVYALLEEALGVATDVRVLVTSREGVGVAGERVVPVPVLTAPALDAGVDELRRADAVELFVVRAGEAGGTSSPTDDELRDIAQLCRRLDGIPLAIELAAARRRSMTPAEILSHLDQRFRVLTGGRRTAIGRHHTMRNAVDWSYDLLDADEQSLLHHLAVFAGTFDLAAVEALTAGPDLDVFDVVDVVGQLVDKSLLVADTRHARTRYRLFETIRDYAWERLEQAGEVDEYSRRHAVHYVGFAEAARIGIEGPDEADWIERVREETDNLHAALRWAIDAALPDLALQLVAALTVSATPAANPFGALAEQAATMTSARGHPLRPLALASAAYSARSGERARAVGLAEDAVAAAELVDGDAVRLRARCMALGALGSLLLGAGTGIDRHAIETVDELIVLADRLGDDHLSATAYNLAMATHPGDRLAFAERALECAERTQNPSRLAFCLLLLARIVSTADSARAHRYLEEAIALASSVGNRMAMDFALQNLALVESSDGDFRAAGETLVVAIDSALWDGDQTMRNILFDQLARTLAVLGADADALLLSEWLRQRGIVLDELAFEEHTPGELIEKYRRVLGDAGEDQRRVAERRAASMTDREVFEVARAALSSEP